MIQQCNKCGRRRIYDGVDLHCTHDGYWDTVVDGMCIIYHREKGLD